MNVYKTHSKTVVFEQKLLKSKAYRALKTPTAYFVLGIFMTRRKMARVGRQGKDNWDITNNGEIVFTYQEAKTTYGISSGAFRKAIDELRHKGFIDIFESGAGLHRSANLYSISDRWKLYGETEYKEPKPRPKGPINRGFQKGNRHVQDWREKKSTVTGQHSSTVVV